MSKSSWDDLAPRLISGAGMVAVGLGTVWMGGLWFHGLIGLVCGLMVWELVRMLDTERSRSAVVLAVAAGAAVVIAIELPPSFALPLLLVPSMIGLSRMETGGVTYAVFTALILLAATA